MIRIVLALALAMAASPAAAMCTNYANLKIGASPADKLYGELDRLICLHNEQETEIQQQRRRIEDLERKVKTLESLALQNEIERR